MPVRESAGGIETVHGDVGYRIVEEVAEAEGVDPLELTPPLHDAISIDALETLFASPDVDGRVEFDYLDYHVTVRADGTIDLGA